MTVRRAVLAALAALGLAAAAAAPAAAAQTQTQRFFKEQLLADDHTAEPIQRLLSSGRGFVDRSVTFRDLTGDEKDDAVVRVQSGGAAGAVAIYVFSTDTGREGSELEVVFRSERLLRAWTSVTEGVLTYRSARPQRGDELCCPSRVAETRLRWDARRHLLRVASRREIAP
jgi:hypothetical protein